MFGLGIPELLIILVVVFLIFGAGKLPQIGSGFGKALRNFKNSLSGKDEIDVTPQNSQNEDEEITAKPKRRQIAAKTTRKTSSNYDESAAPKRKKTVKKA
ncbi:MAG: twin-arginine translocase TatA/TatE family subunit [bacterium]|jgi:sec-independent protein translocase protein TatA|uniref:Sec-independent protein translocase protein TatA n=1 Tax=Candidatus Acidulodesulfobacterium acidiphilum TaxID=2597224 RepID=A0A520X5Q3_9DELT|nr:MAG: twin-arginine translocase TatA/TatE family subunit [Candidatus Acidulodesulfobacterium acidiphilum]